MGFLKIRINKMVFYLLFFNEKYEVVSLTRIILASKSPRRKEILESIGLRFTTAISNIDEESFRVSTPEELVKVLSREKALNVSESFNEDSLVIGSDTVVVYNKKILGKPKNQQKAKEMLQMLSGKKHTVFTGLALIDTIHNREYISYSCTDVYMRSFNEQIVESYIKTNEPMDKAGAYGIQGIGSILIDKIVGDFYTVMGFSIKDFYNGIEQLGYDIFELINTSF